VIWQGDVSAFNGLSFSHTGGFGTGQYSLQYSADGTTFSTVFVPLNSGTLSSAAIALSSTAGPYTGAIRARWLRAVVTTGTGVGSATITLNLLTNYAGDPVVTVQGTVGTAINAGTNAIGDVGIQYRANATGAATTFKFAAAASVNNQLIGTGVARRLLGWSLTNTTAAFKYFRFYNKATAPTSGESPTFMVGLPPNSTTDYQSEGGIAMSLGLGVACTGAVADTDATVTVANDVVGAIFYQ